MGDFRHFHFEGVGNTPVSHPCVTPCDGEDRVQILNGNLFTICDLQAGTQTHVDYIHELQCTDDCALMIVHCFSAMPPLKGQTSCCYMVSPPAVIGSDLLLLQGQSSCCYRVRPPAVIGSVLLLLDGQSSCCYRGQTSCYRVGPAVIGSDLLLLHGYDSGPRTVTWKAPVCDVVQGPVVQHLVKQGPVVQVPVVQRLVVQGPVVQGPVALGLVVQGPVVQGPVALGLVVQGPVVQGPVVQGPVALGLVVQGPIVQHLVKQGPVVQHLVVQGPVVQDPVVQGPVVQGLVVQGPVVQHLIMQGPVVLGPVVQGPVVQHLIMQGPVVQAPVVQGPVVLGLVVQGPVVQGPVLEGPVVQRLAVQGPVVQGPVVLGLVVQGSSITQLQAVDPDGDPLIFGVVGEEASRFFAVEQSSGVVWLRQPLDRETKSEMQVVFSVSDSQGVVVDTVNVQIGDVNDNAPAFHNQPYAVSIPERCLRLFSRLSCISSCQYGAVRTGFNGAVHSCQSDRMFQPLDPCTIRVVVMFDWLVLVCVRVAVPVLLEQWYPPLLFQHPLCCSCPSAVRAPLLFQHPFCCSSAPLLFQCPSAVPAPPLLFVPLCCSSTHSAVPVPLCCSSTPSAVPVPLCCSSTHSAVPVPLCCSSTPSAVPVPLCCSCTYSADPVPLCYYIAPSAVPAPPLLFVPLCCSSTPSAVPVPLCCSCTYSADPVPLCYYIAPSAVPAPPLLFQCPSAVHAPTLLIQCPSAITLPPLLFQHPLCSPPLLFQCPSAVHAPTLLIQCPSAITLPPLLFQHLLCCSFVVPLHPLLSHFCFRLPDVYCAVCEVRLSCMSDSPGASDTSIAQGREGTIPTGWKSDSSERALSEGGQLDLESILVVMVFTPKRAVHALRRLGDTPVGTSVFMVNATDPDQGTGGSVLFSFQPPSAFFSIDGARGIVTVTKRLDYETTTAYQLTVNATDQDKVRPLSSLANLAISITDVQDMDPIFTNLPYSTNIEEEVPLGVKIVRNVGCLICQHNQGAVPQSKGIQGRVASPAVGALCRDSEQAVSGVALLRRSSAMGVASWGHRTLVEGYEVRKIRAIDQDLGRPRGIGYTIISGHITIAWSKHVIAGRGDEKMKGKERGRVEEKSSMIESSPGVLLLSSCAVLVVSLAIAMVSRVCGSVQGNVNSVFALDYISGLLTVNGRLDRENPLYSSGFTLTVKGTELNEDRTPSTASVFTNFTILLIDKNDNSPKFNSSEYRVRITELAQVGFALPLSIQVEDKDEGLNSMFEVVLVGNNSDHFTISPTSVQGRADIRVRVAVPLDFETIRSYSFSLYANESQSEHVGFARVFIDLINENDNRPMFSSTLYNISLLESTPAGTTLLQIKAVDNDFGTFGVVRYYFSDDPDQFTLDTETGWVALRDRLDYELVRRYTLTVLARDGGGEETTGRLRINVVDVNDNPPVFQKDSYTGSLMENQQTPQMVARVRATDEDSPPNNLLTYSITYASQFLSYFSISMVEGYAVITVTRPLDYEQVPGGMVYLTLMAKDGGNPPLNSTVPITIELLDENDNPPEFSQSSYIVRISENMVAGATVLFVTATDRDASREFGQASLIYSLQGPSEFRLNTRSGEVTTTALLDREVKSEYILIVRAVDGGVGPLQKTGIATVNITILDINDNAPVWRDEPYLANVVEMSPINTDVISVSVLALLNTDIISVLAVDPDNGENGTVVYSIFPANPFYIINNRTGKIRTSGAVLDRESLDPRASQLMRTIVISATDRGNPPLLPSASATVQVNLLDLNDNDPAFLNLPFTAEVPEGLSVGSSVFRVQVQDPDEAENGAVTLSLQATTPRADFRLNASSGVLVSVATLDREQIGQYLLRVVAFDAGQYPRTSTNTLTITILDVNDETPSFFPRMHNMSVLESVPRDYIVVRLNCSDNDAGINAELSYFITGGNQDGKFSVGFRNGVVRTVVDLDRETQASYTLVIEAIDNGPAGDRKTGTATVYVEVLDVNDNRPIFLQNSYETTVLESIPRGTSILQVQATDADQGDNGRVLYRVLSGNSGGQFSIDLLSGVITRGQRALDREMSNSHLLEVEAYNTDQGSMRNSVRVIVYVEDVNDERPVFTQQQYNRLGLRETAGVGTSVIVVRATDPDTGDGGAVSYAIVAGADRKFEVDVSTGLVTTVDYLDYETKTSYQMNVSATDQAPPFNRAFCTVYVTLLNELDEAVAFAMASYEASLQENVATGTEVIQVRAQSADNLNQLAYRFDPDTSPAALALFKIDSVTVRPLPHGRITVTGLIDREKGDTYTLTVVADDGGPKRGSTVVSITILDENDNSPEFDLTSDLSVNVPEDTPIGQRVGVVLAHDKDAGRNGLVNFTLVAGNMQDVFDIRTINNTYGDVYVNAPLDRESVDRYLLKVRATDNGSPPRSTDRSLTVNIVDVNDNAPVIQSPRGYNISISENVGGGTLVLRVVATDRDIGPNGLLSYYITDGNQDLTFRMDRVSGEIVTRPSPPDRERQQQYTLTVTVEDEGTRPLSGCIAESSDHQRSHNSSTSVHRLSLTWGDGEEHIAVCVLEHGVVGFAPHQRVHNLAAVASLVGRRQLQQGQGEGGHLQSVHHAQRTVAMGAPGQDVFTALVHVRCEEPGVLQCVHWMCLAARLGADQRHVGSLGADVGGVEGGYPQPVGVGVGVGVVVAVRWTGATLGTLRLFSWSAETRSSVLARDYRCIPRDRPRYGASTTVWVRIIDENDNAPRFSAKEYITVLTEGPDTLGATIATVTATDPDEGPNGTLSYAITLGNLAQTFSINPNTGRIVVVRELDYELSGGRYTLVLTATDQCPMLHLRLTSSATVLVNVIDVNDVTPQFPRPFEGPFEVTEGQPGPRVCTVRATDDDSGLNGKVEYSITAGDPNNEFIVSPVEGDVRVRRDVELDRETTAYYNITVTAKDLGTPPHSSTVVVGVVVLDINDNDPVLLNLPLNASVSEDAAVNTFVGRVSARDADTGRNALLTYNITAGNLDGVFYINETSGVVQVNRPLDRERTSEYTLTVTVKDNPENPRIARRDSDLLVVSIQDVNDNRPIFTSPSYRGEISENSLPGTTVLVLNGPVLAVDRDVGPNAVVRYSLLGPRVDLFTINASTAEVSVRQGAVLDRENFTDPRLDLTVLAQDVGRLNSSVPLTIAILDKNDNPPVFRPSSFSVRLPENSPTGEREGDRQRERQTERERDKQTETEREMLSATDADDGSNGWLQYRLEGGAQDRFVVDALSGAVVVGNATLDREERSSYRLVVVATDRGTPPLSGTASLTVVLDDVNDSRPRFLQPVQAISVNESTPPGVVVATLAAEDPDLQPRLEYYIISVEAKDDGNKPVSGLQESFGIDFHTGAVFVRYPLNRELVATFEIIASVHDNASDIIDMSVSVPNGDQTDHQHLGRKRQRSPVPPVRGDKLLGEHLGGGPGGHHTPVCLCRGPGKGGPMARSTTSFSICPEEAPLRLEDPSTGKILANQTVDYEQVQWLNFTIRVQDQGSPPRSSELPVYLRIVDVNDNNPIFTQRSYQRPVLEDVALGTIILRVSATDADSGLFSIIEYALVDGEGKFGITPSTVRVCVNLTRTPLLSSSPGDIYILSPLDRETKDHYTLTAVARDNPGGSPSNRRENSVQVLVTVLDVNDFRPRFSERVFSTNVFENEPSGTTVITLTAIDLDEGENALITYNLQGPGADAFSLDPDTGVIRSQRLLHSFERFNLTVIATDHGRPPLWGTAGLHITVVDVNDNRPVFIRPANGTIMHILEEQPPGLLVYEVFATDVDEGVNGEVRYGFLQTGAGSRDWDSFRIDPLTGVITTTVKLDREKQALYSLIVVAYDLGQPVPYETTQPLQVALSDIDDNEPVFLKPPKGGVPFQSMSVPEQSPAGTVVGNVTGAVDADEGSNAVVYYFIAGGDAEKNFNLSVAGVLSVNKELDREQVPVYSIIIKASSNRNWTLIRSQRSQRSRALDLSRDPTLQEVRIFLEDINDQSPRFTKTEYTAGVAADAKVGSELIQVQAIDNDVGNNSLVLYHILSIRYIKLQSNDSEDVNNVFTIGETDGIIRTHELFMAYHPGYFLVEVLARDLVGHSDVAQVGLYILREDQRVKIIINEIPDRVWLFQESFIHLLSNITGAIVNMDDVQYHVDKKGWVNFSQTDVLIHVVGRDSNRILDVERVIRLIDENREQLRTLFRNYNIVDVQPAVSARAPEDLTTMQMAIIILAVLLFLAAMLFIFMNWYYRTVHKRKLKAIVAGSTGNQGLMDILDMPNTNKYSFEGANPVWLDPFCRNLELAAQAEHEDDLPENLNDIPDLWNSPARTHGTFGREPQASRPEDDRYLRAAIQEYDNIAKLGQIMREGPIKGSLLTVVLDDYMRLKKLFAARLVTKSTGTDHSSIVELVQSDLDEDDDEQVGVAGGRVGTLRFRHKQPLELRGPGGVHVTHGSTGTLLTADLNSLPEDDQRALARSLEALHAERDGRTESAKSTPQHLHKGSDAISGSPLEVTEL
ncbi:hypothetical protein P4O66_013223 [Electrophorus voltai]|uniref:Cadherin-23 n=1 Tax=Electrophorus voltai TaxID=2609070 RepID=A0AAD8Z1F3_9TELE|nr:hypothetical protein P4O66_013223 [Electrophorus voltai]